MKIWEIIEKGSNRYRRSIWRKGYYIHSNEAGSFWVITNPNPQDLEEAATLAASGPHHWTPKLDDLQASDWEEVQ